MKIATIGIDISKNVFQIHGMDGKGRCVLTKRLSRDKFTSFMANLDPTLIGMEACGGSHHWARILKSQGHEVKLMSPQYVKPYVKTNKNDRNDAEAIAEAVTRPSMHFVSPKSIEQQDIQALHRIRQRLIEQRTALSNQIRGLLTEYGIIFPQGISYLRKKLPEVFDQEKSLLTDLAQSIFAQLYEELKDLDTRVKDWLFNSLR